MALVEDIKILVKSQFCCLAPPPPFFQFCWNIFHKPDPGKYNHVRLLKPFSRGGGPEYKEQNNYLLLAEGPSVARE